MRDQELLEEVAAAQGDEPPEAVEPEEGDAAEEPAGPEASGITSHVLVCRSGGKIATSKSTFRAPTTGTLWMRVGYFNSAGARIYLSPWVNKGSMNALTTKTHVEAWDFGTRRAARAVVVSRFPAWEDVHSHKWADC